MSSSSILSLHVGSQAQESARMLWSLRAADQVSALDSRYFLDAKPPVEQGPPKCVIVDTASSFMLYENDDPIGSEDAPLAWDGVVQQVSRNSILASSRSSPWTVKLHPRSAHRLQHDDLLDVRRTAEASLDSLRFFAEASDSVSAVDVFADTATEFQPLFRNIVDSIRDDYGSLVAIPLWLFGPSSESEPAQRAQWGRALASVDSHNIAIPMEQVQSVDSIRNTLAMHYAMGYRHSRWSEEQAMSTHHWAWLCTSNGRLPVGSLEACIPSVTEPSLPYDANAQQLLCYMQQAFASPKPATMNPFAISLLPHKFDRPPSSIFSNLVVARGRDKCLGAQQDLFRRCDSDSYSITSCVELAGPIQVSESLLHRQEAPSTGGDGSEDPTVTIGSALAVVGTSSHVAAFLDTLASAFPQNDSALEIRERLLSSSEAYSGRSLL